MSDEENFECGKCGRSFDSQRGLSIHQTQTHGEDEGDEDTSDTDGSDPQNSSPDSISLSPRQLILLVFTFGLAIGFSSGIIISTFDGAKITENTDNNQISGASTMAAIKDIADSVGAESEQIASCVESSNTEEIDQDRSEINQITGGIGTPTFFIGNSEIGYTEVTGAQPYSRMKSTIDQKIQEANEGDTTVGEEEYTLDSISFEGEPAMGDSSAPINIVEYSDYGCPWCAEWHGTDAISKRAIDEEDSFNKVKSNYVDTGKVRFVLKDYPVPKLHPNAETVHKASNCVLENSPENFWEFSQKLYEERDKWQN